MTEKNGRMESDSSSTEDASKKLERNEKKMRPRMEWHFPTNKMGHPPTGRGSWKDMLTESPYSCLFASQRGFKGLEALATVAKKPPSLLILRFTHGGCRQYDKNTFDEWNYKPEKG
uniref:Uncharacterized protein n=1 Tax=Pristionchus pacificus TaxID=54126 RepID=A0A2A6BWI0_PRIPA|eukprot:PDM70249.1 hypothetical protein PRIPAC_46495 [Pristionchus pacificus]